jgi:hypothetical protein
MTIQTGLVPNPNRKGAIARVLILREHGGQALVLDSTMFGNNPELLWPFNPGYTFAIKFWKWINAIIAVAGIIASFFWHWWAFIAGWAVSYILYLGLNKSVGQFAVRIFETSDLGAAEFKDLGALWFVDSARIVGRRS